VVPEALRKIHCERNRSYFERGGDVASASFPTNFGAQPLVFGRGFSSLNSMQKLFSIILTGRRFAGAF